MEKKISYRRFMKAMKRQANEGLIISQYNKQTMAEAVKEIRVHGITCQCERPVTYGVLSKKCYRCNQPLKQ